MRILMLTDFYPPIIGGMELHVRNLSIELAARGHDVAVATLWHEGDAEFENDQGVRVYRTRGTVQRVAWLFSDGSRRFAPPLPDPEVIQALRRILAHERPEIVHAHSWMVRSYLPLRRWSGARLVVTLHDFGLRCAKKTLMHLGAPCNGPGFSKCLRCGADHYGLLKGTPTVLSNLAMGALERMAVDIFLPVSWAVAHGNGLISMSLPFRVIPNFIPDNVSAGHDPSDQYLAQLPNPEFLLFVGALGPHKGVQILLQAYAGLSNAPPLVLIGTPWPGMPVEYPANTFVLTNWPHGAVMEAWSRSLMGLVPSLWPEPCPTVVLEAMASGCAVVASQIGGLPEMVADNETGLLVPPGDPMALGKAIMYLLHHPNLRERMGKAGKHRVIRFQASTIIPQVETVYREVAQ